MLTVKNSKLILLTFSNFMNVLEMGVYDLEATRPKDVYTVEERIQFQISNKVFEGRIIAAKTIVDPKSIQEIANNLMERFKGKPSTIVQGVVVYSLYEKDLLKEILEKIFLNDSVIGFFQNLA